MTPAELDTVRKMVEALDYYVNLFCHDSDSPQGVILANGRALLAAPQPHPVGWLESPHGAFRANPLHKIDAPQSVAWSLPVYLAAAPPQAAQETADERAAFEAWWERHGQFCRAGGGDYEKTFAFQAWQARAAQSGEPRRPVTEDEICQLAAAAGIETEFWNMGAASLVHYHDVQGIPRAEFTAFARLVERRCGITGEPTP